MPCWLCRACCSFFFFFFFLILPFLHLLTHVYIVWATSSPSVFSS
jgi:hypothetical protein